MRSGRAIVGLLRITLTASMLLGGTTSRAHADEAKARETFRRGQVAFQQGDYEAAVKAWEEAYGHDARPLILYNLGRALERLGRTAEATRALENYLKSAEADDPYQSDARMRLATLRERLGRTGIRIRTNVEGAAIHVDGEAWGLTPRPDPIPVAPGSHRITLRHAEYPPFEASVFVSAGEVVDLETGELVVQSGSKVDSDAAPELVSSAVSPPAPRTRPSRLGPALLLGIGGAAIIAGSVVGIVAYGRAEGMRAGTPQAEDVRRLGIVSDALLWPGIALAASGIVWWILQRPRGETAQSDMANRHVHVSPWFAPTGAGAGAKIAF